MSQAALAWTEPMAIGGSTSIESVTQIAPKGKSGSATIVGEFKARVRNLLDGNEEPSDTSIASQRGASTQLFALRRTEEFPRINPIQSVLLAEWNGCVNAVQTAGAYFSATLKGVVGEGVAGEEEDAVIPISDVSEWDMELLQPGNFFRLCVVHEVLPTGQPRRSTQVVFRRLPAFRQFDLDKANERGRDLVRGLRVE